MQELTPRSTRSVRRRLVGVWCWVVLLAISTTLFYGIAGYLCTASDIGENPAGGDSLAGPRVSVLRAK